MGVRSRLGEAVAVTLIHTADWQLGKQFANVPGDAGAALRLQRPKTVEAVARLAVERGADAVLVAGDVFDDNKVGDEALRRALYAMAGFDGPWLLLPGNHDPALAESVWTRLARLGLPANVRPLTEAVPELLHDGRLAVLPAPLRRRHDALDPTAWFDAAETPEGAVRVGLAHGRIAGVLPEASEAINEIASDRAARARLDYLALGDWHGTFRAGERTWYSGTPETDRFKENESGGVLVVRIAAPGAPPEVERIAAGRFAWRTLSFRISGQQDLAALEAALDGEAAPDRLVLRLILEGAVDLATRAALDELCARWEARLLHLRLEDKGLIAEASEDDLDRIDQTGFVRAAIERLRALQRDPAHPNRAHAAAALQRLYLEHVRLEG
jgi:DNA repair exonuclease SbcCD nuclease subunit